MTPSDRPVKSKLAILLEFGKRARHAESAQSLQFMLVNETFALVPYQLAVFWTEVDGVLSQSGVSNIDRNAPFVLWLSGILHEMDKQREPTIVSPDILTSVQVEAWSEWLPSQAYWVPMQTAQGDSAGLLLCREEEWSPQDIALINEWCDIWHHPWARLSSPTMQRSLLKKLTQSGYVIPSISGTGHFFQDTARGFVFCLKHALNPVSWFKLLIAFVKGIGRAVTWVFALGPIGIAHSVWQALKSLWVLKSRRYTILFLILIFLPVKLTVLAPAELVPENPSVIRVPTEGVIETFYVKPNEAVQDGQLLFKLDLTHLIAKLQIAQQEMQIALAEYRQSSLQSLSDAKSRTALVGQQGKATERELETQYLKQLLDKAQIRSPRAGVAIFDDPSEWLGKPIVAGEKIMVIAIESQAEIEAWIPLNEAIDFPVGTPVSMYLNTTPLSPVTGMVRYMGHEALQRPDGSYAYRLRATIDDNSRTARIGLRGTVRLSGQYVPLAYWILRKPLVALRQFTGI